MSKLTISTIPILLFCTLIGIVKTSANYGLSDLEAIFTENIQIVDYTIVPEVTGKSYDNERRILIIEDKTYPYPKQILAINYLQSDEQNMLNIEVSESLPDTANATHIRRSWIWHFHPQTEVFERFKPLCGNPRDVYIIELATRWVYITNSDTERVYLCETATGELSEPLLSDFSWDIQPPISTRSVPVFTSPDGQWLVLFGEEHNQIHVFSYNISSANLTELGSINCRFCIERNAVSWFDSLVTIWVWDGDDHIIYSTDITQSNSLVLAIRRHKYLPEFYEDPPRYDYVNFTNPENFWETQCERVIYNVLNSETQITPMGPLCRPEQGSLDGIGYYRDITNGKEGIAALTRFNSANGESEVLYEGEIESIEWVSLDERYAIVVLDANGHIDTIPFLDPWAWGVPEAPRLAYVDLVRDTIVFESWTRWNICNESYGGPGWNWSFGLSDTSQHPCYNIGPAGKIFPRDDGTFLFVGIVESENYLGIGSDDFADLVTVDGEDVIRTRLAEGWLIPFNDEYVIQHDWDDKQRTFNYSLIPVDGGPNIPITNKIPVDDYQSISLMDIYPSTNQMDFLLSLAPELERDWSWAEVTIEIQIP